MQGLYYDPLHGRCLRSVRRVSSRAYEVVGVYGSDEDPHTHRPWTAVMTALDGDDEEGTRLRVDFAGKPLKKNRFMTAVYRRREIHWDDGNVWLQLYTHPRQLHTTPAPRRLSAHHL